MVRPMGKAEKRNLWVGWDIDIQIEPAIAKDRSSLVKQTTDMALGGFFAPTQQNLLVWKLLKKADFPNSDSIIKAIEEQLKLMEGQPQVDENGNPITPEAQLNNAQSGAAQPGTTQQPTAQAAVSSKDEQAAVTMQSLLNKIGGTQNG
jgi:hypothetical protein